MTGSARRKAIEDAQRQPRSEPARADVSGERPSVRYRPSRSDLELTCATRERLDRLYRKNLLPGGMMLPSDTTTKRGDASVCVHLPDGRQMWLRARITDVAQTEGVIRLEFDPLTDVQRDAIEEALG